MTGLTIIIASADAARFRAAMSTALAQAALGGSVRLYCHEASVALLARAPRDDDDGPGLAAAGLPDRPALIAMAQAAGIALIACQTGLALTGVTLEALAEGVEAEGMVSLLATLGADRLVSF